MSLPFQDTCLHHLQGLLFAAESLSPPHTPIHAAASAVNYSSAASIAALNPNSLHPTHHLDLLADEHDSVATGNPNKDPHTDTLAFALQQVLLAKKKKGFVSPLKTARSEIDVKRLSDETQRRLKRNDPIPETEPPTLTVSVATQTEESAPKKQEPNETNRHVNRTHNGNPPFSTDFSNGFPQRHTVMQKRPRTDFNLPRNQPDETNENAYSPSESTSVPIINSIFVTAKEQLEKDSIRQPHRFDRTLTPLPYPPVQNNGLPPPNKKRLLGTSTKRGKFYPPMLQKSNVNESEEAEGVGVAVGAASAAKNTMKRTRSSFQCPLQKQQEKERNKDKDKNLKEPDEPMDERLRNIEPAMVQKITNEIMHQSVDIEWDDIAGLEHAKNSVKEIVVWPMLRPDIFTGLRGPPKGLLLFGPPGTGKTLIGKCIASQSGATFFSISSSSLTSKWIGEGEKMVRALFTVARCHQPAVIFVDEIDSLLSSRTEGEVEASRRIKTEFLIQFDGCGTTTEEDRILVVGATNRPQEIDEAARRRFRKRLYIPLPETCGRSSLMRNLLKKQVHSLSEEEIEDVVAKTEGYSGSDVDGLCREAALGPIRCIGDIRSIAVEQVRPVNHQDFIAALGQVRASVSDKDLEIYRTWNREYGSCG